MGVKFYDGQPVVCVWDYARWVGAIPPNVMAVVSSFIPVLGNKYVVTHSEDNPRIVRGWAVHLAGMPDGILHTQDGFEPITEKQVEEIKRESLRAPQDDLVKEIA